MKQAVVLSAGEGQRLRPFTVTKPKVMLSIADKPILQYVIEALAQNGIRDIVVVNGYRKEQILDFLGSGEQFGVKLTFVTQLKQLGTAHALMQAKDVVENEFLVLSGDNLIDADTIAQFATVQPDAILVKRVDNPVRYGVVALEKHEVKSITEKPEKAGTDIINTGIYAFSNGIFDFIEPELDIPDVINKMIAQGKPIMSYETEGTWLDVAYPWDILRLNDTLLRQIKTDIAGTVEKGVTLTGPVSVGKATVIRSHSYLAGPVVIGKNCDIGPHVCLMPATSIGDNVVISPFTEIKNSVIGDDVSIGPGCIIEDSVIDKGCIIKERFSVSGGQADVDIDQEHHIVNIGAMLGEACRIGGGVTAQPGAIVGNFSQVEALKLFSGRLPDRSMVF